MIDSWIHCPFKIREMYLTWKIKSVVGRLHSGKTKGNTYPYVCLTSCLSYSLNRFQCLHHLDPKFWSVRPRSYGVKKLLVGLIYTSVRFSLGHSPLSTSSHPIPASRLLASMLGPWYDEKGTRKGWISRVEGDLMCKERVNCTLWLRTSLSSSNTLPYDRPLWGFGSRSTGVSGHNKKVG